MNILFLDALHCRNRKKRPPFWMMRQAGRYLPAYRNLRNKYSFLSMCHQPDLIAEVTLLPFRTFPFDAAILFSDILMVAEALGLEVRFEENKGPIIERPITSEHDIDRLPSIPKADSLQFVAQGIHQVLPQLRVPLIGFCGGPFTVASYIVEGGSSRDLKKTKEWMLREPISFHRLLRKISECSLDYLKMQIEAGVQAIQIFDSWAHVLAYAQFKEFSLSYLKFLIKGLSEFKTPVILFCRGSSVFAKDLAQLSPAAISLDWNADISQVRSELPSTIALQGNLDPDILYAPRDVVHRETKTLLNSMHNQPGYIFNLGHGIHPDTPLDSVQILLDTIHETS